MEKKQVIAIIGEKNWKNFRKFIRGKTCGIINGHLDYCSYDVAKFQGVLKSGNSW